MHYPFCWARCTVLLQNHFRLTPNVSKRNQHSQVSCNLCVLSELFWSQNVGHRLTTTGLKIQKTFLGHVWRLLLENGSTLKAKRRLKIFLPISDIWNDFFIWDNLRWKLQKDADSETKSALYRDFAFFDGRKFPPNELKNAKTLNSHSFFLLF